MKQNSSKPIFVGKAFSVFVCDHDLDTLDTCEWAVIDKTFQGDKHKI
jgi:hypothetical protein